MHNFAAAGVVMSPLPMTGILFSAATTARIPARLTPPENPWARVRLRRYETRMLALQMDGNIEDYASEAFATQSAVGEEIGSFFAFDFGL